VSHISAGDRKVFDREVRTLTRPIPVHQLTQGHGSPEKGMVRTEWLLLANLVHLHVMAFYNKVALCPHCQTRRLHRRTGKLPLLRCVAYKRLQFVKKRRRWLKLVPDKRS